MGLRIRWRLAAKGAAVVAAGFVALQLAPSLLKPPVPEPLPADVGLPQTTAIPSRVPIARGGSQDREFPPVHRRSPARSGKFSRAESHIGRVVRGGGVSRRAEPSEGEVPSRRRRDPSARRRSQPKRGTPTTRQDPPAVASEPSVVPPEAAVSTPPPIPESAPPPPPSPSEPPDDGSMEFAPH